MNNVQSNCGPVSENPCGCDSYCVNTEGAEHPWSAPTITTEEIAKLGGWDAAEGVLMIDQGNVEVQLKPGQIVELQPGRRFCRDVLFKRGFDRQSRMEEEFSLIKREFPSARMEGEWIYVPDYVTSGDWTPASTTVAFRTINYPAAPKDFYVTAGLRVNGHIPDNYTEPAPSPPPQGDAWGVFSWTVKPNSWVINEDIRVSANLLRWLNSFRQRFAEGK